MKLIGFRKILWSKKFLILGKTNMPSATAPTARITEKAKAGECDGRGDKMGEQAVLLG